ncbi:MAG: hypothetical protein PHO53_01690 [Actinomycetota bacterium]|nr:hypothetical protein [Actinomycetota bacterium]
MAEARSLPPHGLGLLPGEPPDPSLEARKVPFAAAALPAKVDLTETLPPIGDQGKQPSCVGWAVSYYYKTWWEKKEHPKWELENPNYQFSPSFVFNQIGGAEGADFQSAFELLQSKGDVDIAEFPYGESSYSAQPTSNQLEAAKQYRIPSGSTAYKYFFKNLAFGLFHNDIDQLKAHLSGGQPLVLGIPIFDDFPDYPKDMSGHLNPTAGCYDSTYDEGNPPDYRSVEEGGNFWGGHAVYIAGYDDSVGEGGGFLCVNSWGAEWNEGGKVYLGYEFVRLCALEAWKMVDNRDSSPVISSISSESASPGASVTISGGNFGCRRRLAKVMFPEEREADILTWRNDQIEAKVPTGGGVGNLYVYDWDGEKSNGREFFGDPLSSSWVFAEGATWEGFDEWILILNPNKETSVAKFEFISESGPFDGPQLEVPPGARVSVHVNECAANRDLGATIRSLNEVPIFAERAVYVARPDGKWGSHDSIGSKGTARTWYLAEGATWHGYDEWLLIANPNPESVEVKVSFQMPTGELRMPEFEIGAGTRKTIHVNDYVPQGDVSVKVESLGGAGIVAERSLYIRAPDGKLGCHCSMGLTECARGWGVAEGTTRPGFEEWILIQNPTALTSEATLFFLTEEGTTKGPTYSVGGGTRISVRVNDIVPNRDVSTMVVTAEEDQNVVVERAMYISTADGKLGAHSTAASQFTGVPWCLPEGCTSPGFDEWLLVVNVDPENSAAISVTFMTSSGPVAGPRLEVPPGTRCTFHVNEYVTEDVSTVVEGNGYFICERAMYMSGQVEKRGAHSSRGVLASYKEGLFSSAGGGKEGSSLISRVASLWSEQD